MIKCTLRYSYRPCGSLRYFADWINKYCNHRICLVYVSYILIILLLLLYIYIQDKEISTKKSPIFSGEETALLKKSVTAGFFFYLTGQRKKTHSIFS